jgi:hypothetical protein
MYNIGFLKLQDLRIEFGCCRLHCLPGRQVACPKDGRRAHPLPAFFRLSVCGTIFPGLGASVMAPNHFGSAGINRVRGGCMQVDLIGKMAVVMGSTHGIGLSTAKAPAA